MSAARVDDFTRFSDDLIAPLGCACYDVVSRSYCYGQRPLGEWTPLPPLPEAEKSNRLFGFAEMIHLMCTVFGKVNPGYSLLVSEICA